MKRDTTNPGFNIDILASSRSSDIVQAIPEKYRRALMPETPKEKHLREYLANAAECECLEDPMMKRVATMRL